MSFKQTSQSAVAALIAVLATIVLLPNSASASDWYSAASCDPILRRQGDSNPLSGCLSGACKLSRVSPAEIYENNERFRDAQIIDQGGDRVDVIAQGFRHIFFRTAESCQKFVAGQLRSNQERELERERKRQDDLNKYR
jgi:hypothetical protein